MPTINSQIASSAADAREVSGGTVTLTDTGIGMTAGAHWAYGHYPNFGLPVGGVPTLCTLEVYLVGATDDPDLEACFEAADSAAVPTATAFNISSRAKTANRTTWNTPNQGVNDFKLIDLTSSAVEWAARPARTENSNAGVILDALSGSCAITIRTWDQNPLHAMKLTMTYVMPGDLGAEYTLISYGTAVF